MPNNIMLFGIANTQTNVKLVVVAKQWFLRSVEQTVSGVATSAASLRLYLGCVWELPGRWG